MGKDLKQIPLSKLTDAQLAELIEELYTFINSGRNPTVFTEIIDANMLQVYQHEQLRRLLNM